MTRFLFQNLEKVIPDGGPSKWDSEFAFAKCGFRNFIVKLWKTCWVSMRDFLKTSWKCWRCQSYFGTWNLWRLKYSTYKCLIFFVTWKARWYGPSAFYCWWFVLHAFVEWVAFLDLFCLYCPMINLHNLNKCEYTNSIV